MLGGKLHLSSLRSITKTVIPRFCKKRVHFDENESGRPVKKSNSVAAQAMNFSG